MHLLHSFRVWFCIFSTRFECSLRSVRKNMAGFVRNIYIVTERTQVTFPPRFECVYTCSPLVSSVFILIPHSFRVYLYLFPTRLEFIYTCSPLVSSLFILVPHSFRVYLYLFPTRFEFIYTCSPLVSSVV